MIWLFYASQDRGLPGKLEPVSPVSPAHPDSELDLLPARLSKEELIQNMDRVDREITMVEQQISKLKKKQVRGCGLEGSTCPCFCMLPQPCPCPCMATEGKWQCHCSSIPRVPVPVVTWVVAAVPAHWSWRSQGEGGSFGHPARSSLRVREHQREKNVSSVPMQVVSSRAGSTAWVV